ncbi:lipoprotein [Mesoplasma lactucae]|uniref:Uncharacterized protein n=1 Tax=Mesoplasma lactucae ATCC 49193 TaxID=81460 RepID=A0A291IRR5_9MOLU|nr:lipoprotein [Mesoplasma lactucae]ATG97473.1 hypothetical protein CP520_01720 [Mesoplasma lactucae ATCC 49193]ATZ20072.1 hypothetical protein MLACT_v1c02510 [Mesoplasma lactucae ATCC 49193]MCL8216820.1 hypothetical protein [Mesoplasma lactucae ATCC 49193]
MKKLLSILAAIGITATASTSVVACSKKDGQDASATFKDYQGWKEEAKNNRDISVIFVGGRQNSDSLSFLAALETWTGNGSLTPTDVLKKDNYEAATKAISNVTSSSGDKVYETEVKKIIQGSSWWPPLSDHVENTKKWFDMEDSNTTTKGLSVNAILVNDITKFWSSSLGSDIKSDIYKDINDFADMLIKDEPTANEGSADEATNKNAKSQRESNLDTQFNNAKGPFFIIMRNGKICGLSSGYVNYDEFSPTPLSNDSGNHTVAQNAPQDMKNLFTYLSTNMATSNAYTWISSNSNKETNKSGLFKNNLDSVPWGSKQTGGSGENNIPDLDALGKKGEENKEDSKKDKDDKSKEEPKKQANIKFNIDENKYL